MPVLRTSNFQMATIRPIVLREKHSIVFIAHHLIFTWRHASELKTTRNYQNFQPLCSAWVFHTFRCILQMLLHLYLYK